MKNTLIAPVIFFIWFSGNLFAQDACVNSFTSSNGYTVDITLTPVAVVAPASCPWGYNFNIEIEYSITFSGSNIPGSLNTLQGHMECGSFTNNFFNLPNSGGTGTTTTGGNPWNSNTDCATATVQSLGCTNISLSIQGPALSNRTVDCAVSTPLPITLMHFNSISKDEGIEIKWITESEINNDYFTVERSKDLEHWDKLVKIKGHGNSNKQLEYQFVDRYAPAGTVYYRLRQTDYDGKQMIYGPLAVENKLSASEKAILYPNPNNGSFTLNLALDECRSLQLYNALGNLVWRSQCEILNDFTLPNSIPSGIYFLHIQTDDELLTERVFVEKR